MVNSQSPPALAAPPTLAALITCAAIHQDELGKAYLLGVFAGYRAPSFPVTMPRTVVYLALTDGRGAVPVTVRLVPADPAAAPLFEYTAPPARFTSPLQVKEIAVDAPGVTLPSAGVYLWQVVVGAEVIGERRLVVEKAA